MGGVDVVSVGLLRRYIELIGDHSPAVAIIETFSGLRNASFSRLQDELGDLLADTKRRLRDADGRDP